MAPELPCHAATMAQTVLSSISQGTLQLKQQAIDIIEGQ